MLEGKKIVIGVTGSIAAYKTPLLVRLLKKAGAEVKIIMTEAAVDFVTPLTLSTLSENPVLVKPFDPEDGSWNSHVELGQWADLFVLAPVSANTMAKMATGITDNFFTAAYLSAKCPVMFAPAMDLDMYNHPSTQKNIGILQAYGNILIAPATGELASGLYGEGRMEEPELIYNKITEFFEDSKILKNKPVLVTAGPTYEPVDPVRFIGNHSSGKMGYAIAEDLRKRGAKVTLVSGPVQGLELHPDIKKVGVMTAGEMQKVVVPEFKKAEIAIMTAAVADYRPESASGTKIKKSGDAFSLNLVPTADILRDLGKRKKTGQYLVGFALETENEEANARKKLKEKNLDMIVLNSLREEGSGFGTDTNKVTIYTRSGKVLPFGLDSKTKIAGDIVNTILQDIKEGK